MAIAAPQISVDRQYYPQTPRDYQEAGIGRILDSWAGRFQPAPPEGTSAPLLAAATGAGKTTIIAEALRRAIDPERDRVLVMAQREELIFQLYERIQNQFNGALDGMIGQYGTMFGQPGLGIVMADRREVDSRVIVATVQSLHPQRLAEILSHGAIDYLVVDEAHHAAASSVSYMNVIDTLKATNPNLKMLGVTATPKRSDDVALGSVWTHIAYEWLLPQGIESGYLVPPLRINVKTEVDLSRIKTQAGDYNQSKLISALGAANWLELCYQAFNEYAVPVGKPILSFMPSVEMSQDFTRRLRASGIRAEHIDGTTPKEQRREMLLRYRTGDLQVISNYGVLTEGFDAPDTGVIFLARPTRSRALFTQMLGRGLRPAPGKDHCVLVDMTVYDTKALQVGSLLGKMVKCPQCESEYYFGYKACPVCGYVIPAKEKPEAEADDLILEPGFLGDFVGGRLKTEYGSVFEQAFAAWHEGANGFLSCSVGNDGTLAIVPPTKDDFYRLVLVSKARDSQPMVLNRNGDLASLMLDADREVQVRAKALGDKSAGWRNRKPSPRQLNVATNLGLKIPAGATMGQVSELISHQVVVKQLKRFMEAI